VGQNVVIETHVLTITNSPEKNAEIIAAVGSPRMGVVMDYVNHFQALHQVYDSPARLNHIFDIMGPISFIGHCKDIRVRDGFVFHFDETVPGEGELDLAVALRRWHGLYPVGYLML
jgi:sugar phosphate isomerase/epimerase